MCNSEIYTLSCIVKYIVWARQQCWCSKKYIFDQLTRPCKDLAKSGPWWTADGGVVACADIAEAKEEEELGTHFYQHTVVYIRLRCQIVITIFFNYSVWGVQITWTLGQLLNRQTFDKNSKFNIHTHTKYFY